VPADSENADEVAEHGEHDEGAALPPSTRTGAGRSRSGGSGRKGS
jgi:hypothetical protein